MGSAVRGKGHLHTCIAGRKDNLRLSILRKDNPETKIKILVRIVRKLERSARKSGGSVRKLGNWESQLGN